MTTPLTVYPVHAAATTLTTATLLVATSSGTTGTGIDTAIGTATGYSEIFTRGTSSAWQALGAIGNPSGNGYLFDVTTLEGQGILAGNWTPTIRARINTGNGNLTADFYIRYWKYNGGTYTPIATVSQTGNTLTSTSVNFTLAATALPPIVFGTGDKLYIDVWYNVTANANTLGTGTVRQDVASSTTVGETNEGYRDPLPPDHTRHAIGQGYQDAIPAHERQSSQGHCCSLQIDGGEPIHTRRCHTLPAASGQSEQ